MRGHIAESRITVIDPAAGSVTPRHLNTHIDYTQDGTPAEAREEPRVPAGHGRLAATARRCTSPRRARASSASSRPRELEADTFVPSAANQVALTGGGPTGLVARRRAAAAPTCSRASTTRISIVDLRERREIGARRDVQPRAGQRRQRAAASSTTRRSPRSHGDSACASCHIGGDFDSLAWDLGNPDGIVDADPRAVHRSIRADRRRSSAPRRRSYNHPLKGPMTTQSLRGMANHGAMHWRGDRNGGNGRHAADRPAQRAAEHRHLRRAGRVQVVQRRVPGLLGAQRAARRRRHAGVHRLHPAGDLSAEPDPQPRQLADRRAAGGPRLLLQPARRTAQELPSDSLPQLQRLPHARSATATRGRRRQAGLLRHRRPLSFENEPRSSRSRTCATCTRRSACSGWPTTFDPADTRGLPLDVPAAAVQRRAFQGDQVRGFGFLHDGSVDTVFRFHGEHRVHPARRDQPVPEPGRLPGRHRPTIPRPLSRSCWRTSCCGGRSRRSCWRSTRTWRRSSASRSR